MLNQVFDHVGMRWGIAWVAWIVGYVVVADDDAVKTLMSDQWRVLGHYRDWNWMWRFGAG